MITVNQLAALERSSRKTVQAFRKMEQDFNRMARAFAPFVRQIRRQAEIANLRAQGKTPMWSRYTLGEKELRRDRANRA